MASPRQLLVSQIDALTNEIEKKQMNHVLYYSVDNKQILDKIIEFSDPYPNPQMQPLLNKWVRSNQFKSDLWKYAQSLGAISGKPIEISDYYKWNGSIWNKVYLLKKQLN